VERYDWLKDMVVEDIMDVGSHCSCVQAHHVLGEDMEASTTILREYNNPVRVILMERA